MARVFLGEFEQMVLLSILRVDNAYGLEIRRELESGYQSVSHGGFYTTL